MIAKTNRADFMMVGVAYAGFIALGVPGTLLNIAWSPYIRETFNLSQEAIAALLIASTTGYFIATFTSGRIIARLGIGTMLLLSSVIAVVGLLGMALAPVWPVMVAFAVLSGSASGLIDGGLNIYFAATYGPRLMNWLHAFFGVGATIGTWMMTNIIAANLSWRWGYATVAVLYGVMAVIFLLTRSRWRTAAASPPAEQPRSRSHGRQVLFLPAVWLGVALFFAYGGLEVSSGQWASTLFTEVRGIAPRVAGDWVSLYWGSFTVGRFLFGAFANRMKVVTIIRACMLGAITGAALLWWSPFELVGFIGLALLGFVQAPIFPLLVSNTQDRLGADLAPHAIGFQIGAASVGIALLPGLIGVLVERVGAHTIPPALLVIAVLITVLYEISLRFAQTVRQAEPVPVMTD